jgi:hypothetical protein
VGGKRKTEIRNATPPEFRDLLLSIAWSAWYRREPLNICTANHQD